MSEILVSALVSTYNSEKFIRGCLEDLVNQTLFKKNLLEIIVIDANSQQNEKAIVEEFKSKYPNIIYIRTPERIPLYAAWNVGIKQSRGKYLTNANTDDRHHPAALEILANELEKYPDIALVYPDQIVTNKENESFEKFTVAGFTSYPEFDRQYLLNYTYIGHQPMWRASLHKEFGFFSDKLKVAGDYEWWLRISEKYDFKHIPLLLGLYYYNTEGLERENTQLCLTETFQVRQFYQKKANKPSLADFYPQKTYFTSYIDFTKPLTTIPDVSFILIARSSGKSLISTINSALNQTLKNIEVIVISNSKNDSAFLKNYYYDKRVKVFDISSSLSYFDSLKYALNIAQGRFVSILTDETKLFPRHLELSLSILASNPHISFVTNGLFKVKLGVGNKTYYEYERKKFLFKEVIEEIKKISKEFFFVTAVFQKETLKNEKNLKLICSEPEFALQSIPNFHIPQITWEYLVPFDEKFETHIKLYTEQKISNETQRIIDPSKPPLVSVIIPCYNLAEFLPEAVESVVKQTFTDWECIIVNDGSTDNSRQVAESLLQKYPDRRILYFEKQNEGVAVARNFGILKSKGKYILPLDADDMIEPTFLEKAVKILETEEDIAIVYCGQLHFGLENKIYPPAEWDVQLEANVNFLANSSLFRKVVWDKVGGYKSYIGYEDWEFWINAIEKGFKGKKIPEILFFYRKRASSKFKRDSTKDKIHKARIIKLHPSLYTETQIFWANSILDGKEFEFLIPYEDKPSIMPFYPHFKAYVRDESVKLAVIQNQDIVSKESRNKLNEKIEKETLSSVILSRDQNFVCPSKPPLVSVIIPCYNLAEFLPDAVESVVKQTFTDWECIIVNDGSTDNTRQVAESLRQKYPERRILYFEKQNEGVAVARNFGISKSKGKYILPLDADDLIEPTFLEKAVKILETEQDIAIVYTDVLHFGAEHRIYPSCNWNALLEVNMNYIGNSSLYRKTVWEKGGGYKSNLGYEDWEFWINAIEQGFKGKRIPEVLYLYRVRTLSRFKQDLVKDKLNKAQIIKLHPSLYSSKQLQWAEYVLGGKEFPEPFNDQYCIMPIFPELNLELRKCFENQAETSQHKIANEIQNSYSENLATLQNKTKSHPNVYPSPEIEKLIETSRSDEAQKLIIEFLQQNDSIIPALNDLAISFYLSGKEKEALNLLQTILIIDPNNQIAKENLELIQNKGT